MRPTPSPHIGSSPTLLLLALLLSAALLFTALSNSNSAEAQTGGSPTPVPTAEQPDDSGVQDLPPLEGKLNPPQYPNMDSNLNRIVEQVQTGQFTAQAAAANAPVHHEESAAVTLYVTEGYAAAVSDFLSGNGGDPRNIGADYIEAYIPVSLLAQASQQEGVISIRTIVPPQPDQGVVISEGVARHGVFAWHRAGYRGAGVKIGVIDSGFRGFQSLMGSELPSTVQARCYTDVGQTTGSLDECDNERLGSHGTAVTEAVFDIAPDATYFIADPYSRGDLKRIVEWMIDHDVDVINMSLGWGWDGPGDGTSSFSDSPLNAVDAAVSGGIVWLNSAGNEADDTWFGPFNDPDGDGLHNFTGNSECNPITLEEGEGRWIGAGLRWDDEWRGATRDLDLYLIRAAPDGSFDFSGVINYSEGKQSGRIFNDPYEWLEERVSPGTYCFVISHHSGAAPGWIQLEGSGTLYTSYGSIGNPAESANPGLLAVGASHWRNIRQIESYSSRGPTPDGRIKPDIVGATDGDSAIWGPWDGTSQSSPHLAGMAALVKQLNPGFGPEDIAQYLKDNADPRPVEEGDPSPDADIRNNNTWGHGFARLPASEVGATTGCLDDCRTLLAIKDTLIGDGEANLNWSEDIPIYDWDGVVADTDERVARLNLPEMGLAGTIPPELGSLSNLTDLYLGGNQLTGTIPHELGSLSRLTVLSLWGNELTGAIPPELGSLSNLTILSLSRNELTGAIPPELGSLSNLTRLWLQNNQLTGAIPPELGDLTNLTRLSLSRNELTGAIPPELGSLTNLTGLWLYNNQLTGAIPPELGNLTKLSYLRLAGNNFAEGSCIPAALRDAEIENNDLDDVGLLFCDDPRLNLNCDDPDLAQDCDTLVSIKQTLEGENNPRLNWSRDIHISQWDGVEVDASSRRVAELNLREMGLTGTIPPELGNLSSLNFLVLWDNQLTGPIPSELGNLSNLGALWLAGNQLTGTIPPELGSLSNLEELRLNGTQLTGTIPPELGNLSNLTVLDLDGNQLTGTIPPELGDLSNLTELWLPDNEFTGPIPPELGNLSSLNFLVLWDNQLTGPIPSELGNLSNLTILSLEDNQLTGAIPPELGSLSNLSYLYLAGNNFDVGSCIPAALRDAEIENNDLDELGLPFCGDTPPADPCIDEFTDSGSKDGSWSADCESVTSSRMIVDSNRGSGPHYALYYTFTLDAPADVTITLDSDEDTFLYLLAGKGANVGELGALDVQRYNDDHASSVETDACANDSNLEQYDSCITTSLAPGDYTIETTTYSSGATGAFTVTLTK